MKWLRRIAAVIVLVACAGVAAVFFTALGSEHRVGFQVVQAAGKDGTPIAIGIWYPTAARAWPMLEGTVLMYVARDASVAGTGLPLVLVSHGNGGGILGHADLALALAGAGYIVAAPMHPGDNFLDQHALGTTQFFTGRTRQLRDALDHMLDHWNARGRIDRNRIGAYGFSMGGFTVLTAAGARPDLRQIASHCASSEEVACRIFRQANSPLLQPGSRAPDFEADPRIRAIVVAAPGLGFTLGPGELAGVKAPAQLWWAGKEETVTDAALVAQGLGLTRDIYTVPGAGHFSFLAPCSFLAPPLDICADPHGFDRRAFHTRMNADVLAFFDRHLR